MSTLESSLEEALRQAKLALLDAERHHAQLEVYVQELRTEVAGVEAALHRRRGVGPADTRVSVPTKALDSKFLAVSALPESPAAAGVAALVLLLMDLHSNWVSKKRAAAVESVLKVAGGPVHRCDIAEALKRLGRSDTLESVSAALAYLNKAGKAHPVGAGYWAAAEVQSTILAREVI